MHDELRLVELLLSVPFRDKTKQHIPSLWRVDEMLVRSDWLKKITSSCRCLLFLFFPCRNVGMSTYYHAKFSSLAYPSHRWWHVTATWPRVSAAAQTA